MGSPRALPQLSLAALVETVGRADEPFSGLRLGVRALGSCAWLTSIPRRDTTTRSLESTEATGLQAQINDACLHPILTPRVR